MKEEAIKEAINLLKNILGIYKEKNIDFIYKTILTHGNKEEIDIFKNDYNDKVNGINNILKKLNLLLKGENQEFNDFEKNLTYLSFCFYKSKREEGMLILKEHILIPKSNLKLKDIKEKYEKEYKSKLTIENIKEKYKKEYNLELDKVQDLLNYFGLF